MKKISFIIFPIFLLSCNGNNSIKNQDLAMGDSVAADTMIPMPIEEEDISNNEPTKSKDPFVGSYYCSRSGDTYIFNEDKTGTFIPNGGDGATYKWQLKGHSLIVTYTGESAVLGSSKLRYDKKTHSFIENSISYGKLKFIKQE